MSERFSSEEDCSRYTTIFYELSYEEQKCLGFCIINIASYCKCYDKSSCDCLQKLKNWVSNKVKQSNPNYII
jgi:hypothetical protein